jgi:thiosulfate dehydrogenase [quinone] large subunit
LKNTFFFLKLPIALSLAGHGLVRLPKLRAFAEGMADSMQQSILPKSLITGFGYALPFLEALVGIALLIGFQTRKSIQASLIIMSLLIIGSSTVENWGAIQAQLIHSFYLFGLLWYWDKNQ